MAPGGFVIRLECVRKRWEGIFNRFESVGNWHGRVWRCLTRTFGADKTGKIIQLLFERFFINKNDGV
jgi:hypothetical protein